MAQRREAAALPQPRERRCTDVDEVRAAQRQPRMQTRTDLEPSGRRGSKHGKFRPRIEAVRGDHVPRRPERVVEATIGGAYPTRRIGTSGNDMKSSAADRPWAYLAAFDGAEKAVSRRRLVAPSNLDRLPAPLLR